ncbi:rhomboid family intramembrane serine protease [Rhodosalinus halophilus]|uniref:Rhomboid family intramembrane serine protease n=1 Tax=Rhodosalinus halophilus TaxID=2259333 RepID=A0A365UED4_9RHOB|nr:rhomboid family intramembrane serine protease [Rhodosalinus halophilus]RBI87175.1 rhomboid family intramembrane serine protease [Rhodosalinus halophilus]
MRHGPGPAPVNPLPPVVAALFLVIVAVEAAFSLGARGLLGGPGAVGWRPMAIESYGFNVAILDWMIGTGRWPLEHVQRLVTYQFVHASFTHALFAGIMLLALGKMVGEVFGALATLSVFVVPGIAGALVFGLLLGDPQWLVGAFPGVYGLIGAFTYLLWTRLGEMGEQQIRAFTLIGFLLAIQLIFGLLFGAYNDWIADLAGFATGFLMSFFVSPGGWARLRARLRHD